MKGTHTYNSSTKTTTFETIRSSFFSTDRFSGTELFLNHHSDGWYRVQSRFMDYGKRRKVGAAIKLFEDTLHG